MADIVGLVAVLGAFSIAPGIVYLRNKHRLAEKRLELEAKTGGGGGKQVKQLDEENKLLRDRVENLESIVCSVDYEINQKLAKMIDEQRSQVGLPAPANANPAGLDKTKTLAPERPAARRGDRAARAGAAQGRARHPGADRERPRNRPPGRRDPPRSQTEQRARRRARRRQDHRLRAGDD